MGKAVEQRPRQTHVIGERVDAGVGFLRARHATEPIERIGDSPERREARIEAIGRILEHHLQFRA